MNNLSLFLLGLALIYTPVSAYIKQCFSLELGYPCCKDNVVYYVDDDGKWGVENGQWCGIGFPDSCFAETYGYPCCESCEVKYSDASGKWGKENKKWCGIKDSCDLQGLANFDFEFLKLENNKENMLYSPLSIKYALSMLQDGSVGDTYIEIQKVIGNKRLTKYSGINKVLSLANGLFIRDTYYNYVKTQYINNLKNFYDAEVVKDAFKDATNANQWIEDKTLGIIKNMLSNNQVTDSVMLLINALAIDMEWQYQFDYKSTYGRYFYLDNGEKLLATTMSKSDKSKYTSFYINDDITVLTMDLKEYNGIQFEFMAIMPKENLSNYVKNITKEQIDEIDENLTLASDTQYGTIIHIPKFKFGYDLRLKEDLTNLGIKDVFNSSKANFTLISEEPLYVTDALHKADIEFTEDGAKAAAVTVFLMAPGAAPGGRTEVTYPIDVFIDKPFMFLIRDKKSKDVWFTGTVYEPNKWEDDEAEYEPKSRY